MLDSNGQPITSVLSDSPLAGSSQDPGQQDAPQQDAPQQDGEPQGDPAWWSGIPEKFRADTPEESLKRMSGAYTELEPKYTQARTRLRELERPALKAPEVESAQAAFGKVLGDALENEKVDWRGMFERYFAYQELTASDRARLEAAGIHPGMFEDVLMGERTRAVLDQEDQQKAEAEAAKTAAAPQSRTLSQQEAQTILQEFAGGNMDTLTKMGHWGEQNLGKERMDGIQRAINTGDIQVARAALTGLHTAYQAAQGQERPLQITGGRSPVSETGPVTTREEAQKILRDPRYKALDDASRVWRAKQEAREWRLPGEGVSW